MKYIYLIVLSALLVVYYIFSPSQSAFFPRCPLKMLTGLSCPGCGSQRAVHSLLHLDFCQAFHYNALLVCSLPFLALLIYGEFTRTSQPSLYRLLNNRYSISACFIITLLWWILRNIYNF